MARRDVIAVIDDCDIVRDATECLLNSSGYAVESYASASNFLAAADASQATCLMVDIELGDLLGTELVHRLLARGLSFPVIFMSGSTDETFRRAATVLGCTAFLTKPFSPGEVLHAVERAVAPQRYQRCG